MFSVTGRVTRQVDWLRSAKLRCRGKHYTLYDTQLTRMPTPLDAELARGRRPTRWSLLPTWIKAFVWLFLLAGALVPVGVVFELLGKTFALALYGFEAQRPFSGTGLMVLWLFALKAGVAYGLWRELPWAVELARADAMLGIALCLASMFVPALTGRPEGVFALRVELIPLGLYLAVMSRLRARWRTASARAA